MLRNKFIKYSFTVLVIAALCIFILKDPLSKKILAQYAARELSAHCSIKAAHLGLRGIFLKEVSLKKKGFSVKADSISLSFYPFLKARRLAARSISLENLRADIFSIKEINDFILAVKQRGRKHLHKMPKQKTSLPLQINLSRTEVEIENNPSFQVSFSAGLKLTSDGLFLQTLNISGLNFFSPNFSIKGLSLKEKEKTYCLNIPSMKLGKKDIKKTEVYLKINGSEVEIIKVSNTLLEGSYVSGKMNFDSYYRNAGLTLKFSHLSFERILNLFSKKEDVSFKGYFQGELRAQLRNFRLVKVKANAFSQKAGIINVKNQQKLAFLRKYLDDRSYQSLVDSFKKYEYNKGRFTVKTEGSDLIFSLDFYSHLKGKRIVIIDFHNALRR